jgi:hypothetical protein
MFTPKKSDKLWCDKNVEFLKAYGIAAGAGAFAIVGQDVDLGFIPVPTSSDRHFIYIQDRPFEVSLAGPTGYLIPEPHQVNL